MNKNGYRKDIQSLRGFAVIAVVLFHAFEKKFPLGYLGVDVFFVISGFVVTPLILRIVSPAGMNENKLKLLREFYSRRFWRLAPALSTTLVLSAVLMFLAGSLSDQKRFAQQGFATLILSGNLGGYKFAGNYFSPNPNPLIHTWSLSVEEQFYLLIPLLALIVTIGHRKILRNFTVLFILITSASVIGFVFPSYLQEIYSYLGFARASEFSFYSTAERIWQFGLGSLTFLLLNHFKRASLLYNKSLSVLFLFAFGLVLYADFAISTSIGTVLATLFTVACIITRALDLAPVQLRTISQWFGDRSYSIYLIHMPLIYLAKYSPLTSFPLAESRTIQTALAVFLTILLGDLSYKEIESRFKRDRSRNRIKLSFNSIIRTTILSFLLPFSLFAIIYVANEKDYWGLDRNVDTPVAAWSLDLDCQRMSNQSLPCSYNTKGSRGKILLIGDSQAAQFSQAIVDAAHQEKFDAAVWTQGLCYVQFQRTIINQVTDECMSQNRRIYQWVIRNNPSLVVVAQQVRADASINDLTDGLARLKKISQNMLLIENIPKFPDDKDFMIGRPVFMDPYVPPKYFPIAEIVTYNKKASEKLATNARSLGIDTIDFTSLYCDERNCRRHSKNEWLYSDTGHLSVAGAKLTIPQFVTIFSKIQ